MRKPAREKNSEAVRVKIAQWYRSGWTQALMAKELGLTQQTVCEHLKRIRAEWKQSRLEEFEAVAEVELEKLDAREAELIAAYERTPLENRTVELAAKLSDSVVNIVKRRCGIRGTDAPKKPDGSPVDADPMEPRQVLHERLRTRLNELIKAGLVRPGNN